MQLSQRRAAALVEHSGVKRAEEMKVRYKKLHQEITGDDAQWRRFRHECVGVELVTETGRLVHWFFAIDPAFAPERAVPWLEAIKRETAERCASLPTRDDVLREFFRRGAAAVYGQRLHEQQVDELSAFVARPWLQKRTEGSAQVTGTGQAESKGREQVERFRRRNERCRQALLLPWDRIAFALALTINVLLLATAFLPRGDTSAEFDGGTAVEVLLRILGVAHLGAALVMVYVHWTGPTKTRLWFKLRELASAPPHANLVKDVRNPRGAEFARHDYEILHEILAHCSVLELVRKVVEPPPTDRNRPEERLRLERERLFRIRKVCWYVALYLNAFYLVPYVLFSVLALFISPFFNVFHMFDFVRLFDIPFIVFRSIVASKLMIAAALGFAFIATYAMSALRFAQFNTRGATYSLGPDFDLIFRCDSTFADCFFSHLDGGEMSEPNWDVDNMSTAARLATTIYNLGFRIVVNVLVAGLVTSILLDSFSQLRERNDSVRKRLENSCLVCNLRKPDFDDAGRSLHDHICAYHNLFAYLLLWDLLERRKACGGRLTPLERHVLECFERSRLALLPLGQTTQLAARTSQ